MITETVRDILRYTDKLRQQENLDVSFGRYHPSFHLYDEVLLPYEIHKNPYCAFLKTCNKTIGRCMAQKEKLRQRAITEAMVGCCYAGVREVLFPVRYQGHHLLNIHISGYREQAGLSGEKHRRAGEKYGLAADFDNRYEHCLSEDMPSVSWLIEQVKPLQYMFGMLYLESREIVPDQDKKAALYRKTVHYLCEHYAEPITGAVLAEALLYSEAHIRHVFYERGGETPHEYLTRLRLQKSLELLLYTSLSIGEVAASVGVPDANYFSVLFHRAFGVTPTAYRKTVRSARL